MLRQSFSETVAHDLTKVLDLSMLDVKTSSPIAEACSCTLSTKRYLNNNKETRESSKAAFPTRAYSAFEVAPQQKHQYMLSESILLASILA